MKPKVFCYKAMTQSGDVIRGTSLALSEETLFHQLKQQGQYLIKTRVKGRHLSWGRRIPVQEVLDFCLHMQYMEQAGVPLIDALQDAHDTSRKLRPTLALIISDIRAGKMLSEAIAQHPEVFPSIFTDILRLSEQSGQLSQGFRTLYDHLSWTEINKKQLSKSLQYPFLVFILIGIVMVIMSSVVIPQMMDLIKVSGVMMPPASALLLSINQGLLDYAPFGLSLILALVMGFIGLRMASHHYHQVQDRWILKIPFVGRLLQKRDITLFVHFFYVCLASHVDLLDAMRHARASVRNLWIKKQLSDCLMQVQDGMTLSQAMLQTGVFEPTCLRMVQIGEVTGQLPSLLAVVETYQTRDLKRQIDKFLTFLQPALLGIIGLMLIWIVIGVFYPIYDQMLVLEG